MRRQLVAASLSLALAGGCGWVVRHPAATAGIVAGSIGWGTCELAGADHGKCALVGAGAGALLALVAAGALWLGSEDAPPDPPPSPPPPAPAPPADPSPAPP